MHKEIHSILKSYTQNLSGTWARLLRRLQKPPLDAPDPCLNPTWAQHAPEVAGWLQPA